MKRSRMISYRDLWYNTKTLSSVNNRRPLTGHHHPQRDVKHCRVLDIALFSLEPVFTLLCHQASLLDVERLIFEWMNNSIFLYQSIGFTRTTVQNHEVNVKWVIKQLVRVATRITSVEWSPMKLDTDLTERATVVCLSLSSTDKGNLTVLATAHPSPGICIM